jgi:S1/P1 Nuclease
MKIMQARKSFTALLGMCLIAMQPTSVAAWGTAGHRMVARLATQYLNPITKDRLLELIRYEFKTNKAYYLDQQKTSDNPNQSKCVDLFLINDKTQLTDSERARLLSEGLGCMAPWPDPPVKRQRPYTGNWHFVDIPVVLKPAAGSLASQFAYDAANSARYTYDPARDCATDPANGDCALQAVVRLEAVVGNPITKDQGYGESLAARVEALKFLIHIIGDIHQPLHCVTDKKSPQTVADPKDLGDLGGNTKIASWFGETKTPYGNMNLHSIWDDGFISQTMKRGNLTEESYLQKLIAGLPPAGNSKLTQKQAGDLSSWTTDSYSLAINNAYGKLPPMDMNYEYEDRFGKKHKGGYRLAEDYYMTNKDIIDDQLRLGGVRLARILNTILNK